MPQEGGEWEIIPNLLFKRDILGLHSAQHHRLFLYLANIPSFLVTLLLPGLQYIEDSLEATPEISLHLFDVDAKAPYPLQGHSRNQLSIAWVVKNPPEPCDCLGGLALCA